jgi:hypothetical protein
MRFQLQSMILICLILLLPTFLFASNSAMLTAMGPITTNGHIGLNSSALFAGDVVATPQESAATINAEGSMVLVQPDSSVQFQPNAVVMEHGGVVVTTWKGMAVRTGKFTITPAASGTSKFEVSDSGGVLQIAARQGAVNINDGTTTTVLQEGQQTTRQEPEQAQTEEKPAKPAASGVHVRRKVVGMIAGGAAAGTTVGIILATRGGGHHVSPATP